MLIFPLEHYPSFSTENNKKVVSDQVFCVYKTNCITLSQTIYFHDITRHTEFFLNGCHHTEETESLNLYFRQRYVKATTHDTVPQ